MRIRELRGAVAVAALLAVAGCGGGGLGPVSAIRFDAVSASCSAPVSDSAYVTVPLGVTRARNGAFLTTAVCIGDRGPFNFLVDTGAPTSVIDGSLAQQLGGVHWAGRVCGGRAGAISVTGMHIGSRFINPGVFAVGNIRSLAGNLSGVIGADLLDRMDTSGSTTCIAR